MRNKSCDVFALAAFSAGAYGYTMSRPRLSRQHWIDAGLAELVKGGPAALAAEPLARVLKTTKGSFYWHFKDVPDYRRVLIKHWQAKAFADVVGALEADGTAEQRLRRFGKDILSNPHDPAMRAWARADASVARTIQQVDAERLKYLSNLMEQVGLSNEDFARSCLAALIGLPAIANRTKSLKAFETMIDVVLALK